MKRRYLTLFILVLAMLLCACRASTTNNAGSAAQNTTGSTAGELISEDRAKEIALDHAGLKEADVTWLRVDYEIDDGVKEYEVDFRSGDWEYDYTIHAENGQILAHEKDHDPAKPTATDPTATDPTVTDPTVTNPTVAESVATKPVGTETMAPEVDAVEPTAELSAEEAKAIALEHAGLSAADVTWIRAEYDRDDGVPEYEIEFRHGGYEYDYEIHAETGKILSQDKERDD